VFAVQSEAAAAARTMSAKTMPETFNSYRLLFLSLFTLNGYCFVAVSRRLFVSMNMAVE
jgi:hypothetical protein